MDATGRLVIPGGVDAHTHLHLDVGAASVSDDFGIRHRGRGVGGTTTVIEYVTTRRGQHPLDAVVDLAAPGRGGGRRLRVPPDAGRPHRRGGGRRLHRAGDHLVQAVHGLSRDPAGGRRGDRRGAAGPRPATAGWSPSTPRTARPSTGSKREALAAGRRLPIEHALTRPPEVEGEATARAAAAGRTARRRPSTSCTSARRPALTAVRTAQERGVTIMAETCPQYLYLDVDRLEGPDAENFVCTPPLRSPRPRRGAVARPGRGDGCTRWPPITARSGCTIATPAPPGDPRAGPTSPRSRVACPGSRPAWPSIWDGVRAGHLTVPDWVRLCAEAPARTFGLWPRKGSLAVGADADVVVWDPSRAQSLVGRPPCTCAPTTRPTPARR